MYKKILIINPFGIGDVLFTTPIIHTIKQALPDIKIGYLCNRRTAYILEDNPFIDYIFVYERDEFIEIRKQSFFIWLKNYLEFLNKIKKARFDVSFDFSLNTLYGFFSYYAGIKERIGYDYKNRGRFLTKKIKLNGFCDKHIVEYYAGLLKFINLDLKYKNLELYIKEVDTRKAEEILLKEGCMRNEFLVGVIPGGGRSWGKDSYLKHWPIKNFAQLADKIIENYKAKIIILGDFFEESLAKELKNNMHYKAIDICGKTTIGEFAAILNKMDLVIANDGGPLHMAVALGKKTVSFFGPVDPKVYGPYPPNDSHHIVLRKNLDCSPCYRNFRLSPCQRDRVCLETIDVDETERTVNKLLQ